jgi:TonB family protein
MAPRKLVLALFILPGVAGLALIGTLAIRPQTEVYATATQSGTARSRSATQSFGVNLIFAIYQYDATRSPAVEPVATMTQTFSSAKDEIVYLRDKQKLEGVEMRHLRSVGLGAGETFTDAMLLGPEYMVISVTPVELQRGNTKVDVKVKYANEPLLDAKAVHASNFETVLLRGGKGMFGIKYFVGSGGRRESAPLERTLLVSVTPEIVPASGLRNRPEDISHPVDEYGAAIALKEGDRFTPPVALERVVPKFESERALRGTVLLGGVVTPEGKIINVNVMRSLDPEIDPRAVEALRQYHFSPALLNGKPVYATFREEVGFESGRASAWEVQEEIDKQRNKNSNSNKRRRRPWPFAPGSIE